MIACDIDSTIWNADAEYERAALELYGRSFYEDGYEFFSVSYLRARYGRGYQRIFREALRPDLIPSRQLYPGVVEALTWLSETSGHRILFFTHQSSPRDMRTPLQAWLHDRFPFEFDLLVHTPRVRKVPRVKSLGGVAVIDDHPDTLRESVAAGLRTFTKIQPWNEKLVESSPLIRGFNHWSEFPSEYEKALWRGKPEGRAGSGYEQPSLGFS